MRKDAAAFEARRAAAESALEELTKRLQRAAVHRRARLKASTARAAEGVQRGGSSDEGAEAKEEVRGPLRRTAPLRPTPLPPRARQSAVVAMMTQAQEVHGAAEAEKSRLDRLKRELERARREVQEEETQARVRGLRRQGRSATTPCCALMPPRPHRRRRGRRGRPLTTGAPSATRWRRGHARPRLGRRNGCALRHSCRCRGAGWRGARAPPITLATTPQFMREEVSQLRRAVALVERQIVAQGAVRKDKRQESVLAEARLAHTLDREDRDTGFANA